jgi:hypothetical protein
MVRTVLEQVNKSSHLWPEGTKLGSLKNKRVIEDSDVL